mmetsp:Transcript_2158/g.4336  ORF Transcript_2158/g.4336 Transcript_2158/m.4336 type:complete len:427 (-) Transcript_2158:49-1329(-)
MTILSWWFGEVDNDPVHDGGIQIGLNPLITWAGGILIWLAFVVLQAFFLPRRDQHGVCTQMCADLSVCCMRKGGYTVFIYEATLSWFDFVSDLAIALGAWIPHVALFVLIWVFIGVQVFPYLWLILILHPPKGWMHFPPFAILLNCHYLYAAPIVQPAAKCTAQFCAKFFKFCRDVFWGCWDKGDSACWLLSLRRTAAVSWIIFGWLLLGITALVLLTVFWTLVLVSAILMVSLFLTAWVLQISCWLIMRLLLVVLGFLLYVTMLLPFPDAPATQFFYKLWCQKDLQDRRMIPADEEARQLEESFAKQEFERTSVYSLSFRGVNMFALHFAYIADLLLESTAQIVLQILVAALSAWTMSITLSITISIIVVAYFAHRYIYWLLVQPCWYGISSQKAFVKMHLHYYHDQEKGKSHHASDYGAVDTQA